MLVLFLLLALPLVAAPRLESVQRIWGQAPHSAFGDLIHAKGRWFCVFREGARHVAGGDLPKDDGKIRVISSTSGAEWVSEALIEEDGVDLRDPHISVSADNRLMLVMGGSVYENARYMGRRPRVAFSSDGRTWSRPRPVLREGDWLWRVTWHEGVAWGVVKYGAPLRPEPGNPRRVDLVRSKDGIAWEQAFELGVPGGDETTLRFLPDGTMIALMRRVWGEKNTAMIGRSKPPYKDWTWNDAGVFIGGPDFIVLPGGGMYAGGRYFRQDGVTDPVTVLARMTAGSYQPVLTLPSGGDSGYPAFVFHEGKLWMSYYSSHEGNTAIYLARVSLGQ